MLIDWFTVAAQTVNFLILVWVLKRFLYKPVLAAIDQREKCIATLLEGAEKKKAEALKEQADFQRKIEEFEQERSRLLLEATTAADTERRKLLEAARQDAEDLRAKLQKAVYGELDSLNRKIEKLAQQEVFSIVRKTLEDLSGVSLEECATQIFVRRLRGMSERQKEAIKAALHASSKPAFVRSAFELAPPQKVAIADVVQPLLDQGVRIEFETKPELIGGLELAAEGQKITWSITDYLTSLAGSVSRLLEPKFNSNADCRKEVAHAA